MLLQTMLAVVTVDMRTSASVSISSALSNILPAQCMEPSSKPGCSPHSVSDTQDYGCNCQSRSPPICAHPELRQLPSAEDSVLAKQRACWAGSCHYHSWLLECQLVKPRARYAARCCSCKEQSVVHGIAAKFHNCISYAAAQQH